MQFWQSIPFTHPEDMLRLACVAEEAGFEGVGLADHVFAPEKFTSRYPYDESGAPPFDGSTLFPEVWSTIAALSQVTTTLRFLTNVYILPLRHPIEIAKQVSTAAVISKNRTVLGFGAGWLREEFENLGVPFEARGRRMDEQIPIIKRLMAGETVAHDGEFYRFGALRLNPVPTEPVPMWVGGMNPAALRRAGQFCDGWTGAGGTFEHTVGLLTEIRSQRERFGRLDQPFDCLVPLTAQPTHDQMAQLVELGMTATVSWPLEYQLPPGASLDAKCEKLRELGETMIRPVNG
jgi:probable F420-dependent oxidoreductase